MRLVVCGAHRCDDQGKPDVGIRARGAKGELNVVRIAIVTGSTRPGRNNLAVAAWVHRVAQERKDTRFELVEIADYQMPLLGGPMPPIIGPDTPAHTKISSEKIHS